MNRIMFSPRLWALLVFACAAFGASSLQAVPMTLKYQVTDLGGGSYQYEFILHVDNNDNSYQLGQGWRWLIFGDAASAASPLTNWQMPAAQFPVGPWTAISSSGGGHNGPTFSNVLDYWIPTGIGDALHWYGTSTANLLQGQLLWSTIAGTLGGGVAANFTVAQRIDPGIRVDATTGTAAVVLNNETGGGNGYQAAKFTLTNNSAVAATASNIQIRGMGTGNHTSSYTEVKVYRDQTASGTVGSFDTGDALIATAAFAGSPPVADFPIPAGAEQNFAASEVKTYFIVDKLNGTAPASVTLSYRVENVTVGGSATLFGVPSRVMAGLFILGPEVAFDGFAPTVNKYVVSGASDYTAAAFRLSATSTNAHTISSITLTKTGSAADSDITAVKLFEDQNNNRRLDPGEPQVGSTQTFGGGTLTFSGSPLISLAASQQKSYVVTYTLGNGLANGTTLGASLTPASDIAANPGPTRQATALPGFQLEVNVVSSFPYTQNFDAFTYTGYTPANPNPLIEKWYNDLADGGADWMTYTGSTPTGGTGPTGDHTTGSGRYLYVEDNNFSSANGFINLISPAFDISALGAPVAEFWVHDLNGGGSPAYDNRLHVDWIDATTGAVTNDMISPLQSNNNPNWFQVSIDLSSLTASVIFIRLRWEGTGTQFYNDICVDDFGVRDTPEINVKNSSASSIPDGGTDAIGGVMTTGQTFTWTIENLGGVNLNLTGSPTVIVTPVSNVNVNVTSFPAAGITSAGTDTFDVNVQPIAAGAFSFTITIPNDDPNENPYDITVTGTGVSNQPPQVSIPGGSNWVNVGGNFELTLDPGTAYNDDLEITDPTPDNMTLTVTPPGTQPTTITSAPASIGTPTAGPLTLNWNGTADASNPPGTYTWQLSVSDGINTVNFTASIIINDLPPTHAIGSDATTGDGLTVATAYNGTAEVGSTAALTLADVSNPNTNQATTLGTVTPNAANPTGGSGFNITLVGASIVATPAAALQLADLGTHEFAVDIEDDANVVTVHVSVTVVSPEIGVDRAGPIADGGSDTITGALAGVPLVLTYTVSNTGTSNLTITTVVVSGQVNCAANVTANPAGAVTPSNTTTFDVTVTPTAPGAFSFTIAINNSDVDENPYDIAASGNAAAAPEIDVDRVGTPITDGGTDNVGNTNSGQGRNLVYTITNNGTSNLTVGAVTATLPVNCTATVTVNPAATVAPGGTTTFTVRVAPTTPGPFSVAVAVVNDDGNENPFDFTVTGTGTSGGTSGGGGGGGGGGGCSGAGQTGVGVLLALMGLAALRMRRRRA